MMLSIVVPAYNEETNLPPTVDGTLACVAPRTHPLRNRRRERPQHGAEVRRQCVTGSKQQSDVDQVYRDDEEKERLWMQAEGANLAAPARPFCDRK